MDELRMIASMLAEEPPPHAAARGRGRLAAQIREPHRNPPRRLRWPVLGGFGLAATAAAATGAVLLSSGTTPRAPDTVKAQPVSAQSVLLAAARTADAAPEDGKYWHTRSLSTRPVNVGPKGAQYWMDVLIIHETWVDSKGQVWSGYRRAGARPHSAADKAAWTRDGSPSKWVTHGEGTLSISVKPEPGTVTKARGPKTFALCDKEMSYKQVRALPSDPGALRNALTQAMLHNDDGPVPPGAQRGFLADCATGLLGEAPAPAKVRGAAYRVLAGLPGVKITGRTTDERGRAGVGFDIGTGPGTRHLVIEPKTSLVLSETSKGEQGGKLPRGSASLVLESGRTDSGPAEPRLP
ncbi:CU044_5270 family protein [Actinomadura roseirufa]|uniref:CU044_5270 family protein n=1 Tax=Actinomadura roseirufa TaxID=2094049 RepID=UPI001040F98C|nr:CU044_5270 family protein [Actinomadura roseirufa]